MTHLTGASQVFGPHPVFDSAPFVGFRVGEAEDERAFFVFVREERKPPDWKGTAAVTANRVPNSGIVLRQDHGPGELTLTSLLLFRDADMHMRFRRLIRGENGLRAGTLRMRADRTMWPGRLVPDGDRTYVEFDGVTVIETGEQTFDVRGCPILQVTFAREDPTWS